MPKISKDNLKILKEKKVVKQDIVFEKTFKPYILWVQKNLKKSSKNLKKTVDIKNAL